MIHPGWARVSRGEHRLVRDLKDAGYFTAYVSRLRKRGSWLWGVSKVGGGAIGGGASTLREAKDRVHDNLPRLGATCCAADDKPITHRGGL